MELHVDDILVGEIHQVIDREDVTKAYSVEDTSRPLGFDHLFALPHLSPGLHTLLLKAIDDRRASVLHTRRVSYCDEVNYTLSFVGIEMSRMCNFHCEMCPAHSRKARHGEMKEIADGSLIERVIAFLKSPKYRIREVAAGAIWGEPLMNNVYFENTQRMAEASSGAYVTVTTNSSFLTASNIEKILDLRYIRQVAASVDAGTKQTFERIRKGGKWEILITNLSRLVEEKKRRRRDSLVVSTNFVVMRDNFRELPMYVRRMADLGVDVIGAVNVHNVYSSDIDQAIFDLPGRASDVADERERVLGETYGIILPQRVSLCLPKFSPSKPSIECSFRGASSIYIGIKGDVYPCCVIQSLDYEGSPDAQSMGNVFDDELESIWNSRLFADFRQRMLQGQAPNSICLGCPFFYGM